MKKLLFALLLISGFASAQTPPGYTKINARYDYIAMKLDSGLHIPGWCGVPISRSGVWVGDGQLGIDTCNNVLYFYTNSSWQRVNIDTSGQFIDTVIRRPSVDSIDFYKGGVRFSVKDSIGASGNFVDSLRRVGLNVQAQKSGVWTTQYTDSVGGGSGTVYVDSVFINGSDDSLIVLKNGFRYASLLPSGGGSQTLQDVTTLGNSTDTNLITTDTLTGRNGKINGLLQVGDTSANTAVFIGYGNSTLTGQGVTASLRFFSKISVTYGLVEWNRAISGSAMRDATVNDSSMFNRIYTIPTYNSAAHYAILFDYGINDAANFAFDTTTFKTKYSVVIDSCIARGWPLNRIVILGASYVPNATVANVQHYATAAMTVAATKGVKGINLFTAMQNNGGGIFLQSDSVHPNVAGHYFIANTITHAITDFALAGRLEVNGSLTVKDSSQLTGNVAIGLTGSNRDKVEIEGGVMLNFNASNTRSFHQQYLAGADYRWGMDLNSASRKVIFYNKGNGELSTSSAFEWTTGTTTTPSIVMRLRRSGSLGIGIDPSRAKLELVENSDIMIDYTGSGSASFIGQQFSTGSAYKWGMVTTGASRKVSIVSLGSGESATGIGIDFQTSSTGTLATAMAILRNGRIGVNQSAPDSLFQITGGGLWANRGVRFSALPDFADTISYKPVVINSSGTLYKATYWPGGGGSTTPAGNYGNIQVNRNALFDSPASDSLDFDGGLSVKGTISGTSFASGAITDSIIVATGGTGALKKINVNVIAPADTMRNVSGPTGYTPTSYSPRQTFNYQKAVRYTIGDSVVHTDRITPTDSTASFDLPTYQPVQNVGTNDLTATTDLMAYTTPSGAVGIYEILLKLKPSAVGGGGVLTTVLTYKDEDNETVTYTMITTGAASTLTGAGTFHYPTIQIAAYPSTEIKVTSTLTVGSMTYNAYGTITYVRKIAL